MFLLPVLDAVEPQSIAISRAYFFSEYGRVGTFLTVGMCRSGVCV